MPTTRRTVMKTGLGLGVTAAVPAFLRAAALADELDRSRRGEFEPEAVLAPGEQQRGEPGEVRQVADRLSRLREASRHGFRRVVTSIDRRTRRADREGGLDLATAASVEEAVALALTASQERGAKA